MRASSDSANNLGSAETEPNISSLDVLRREKFSAFHIFLHATPNDPSDQEETADKQCDATCFRNGHGCCVKRRRVGVLNKRVRSTCSECL